VLPIRTILHPTDFSAQSEYALSSACSLARDHQAKLIMLHVTTPTQDPWFKEDLEELRRKLNQWHAEETGVAVERELAEGIPFEGILQVAANSQCDLIVMGTHGRSGLGRALLGSVAEQVVRRAPCPVLTVKVPSAEAEEPLHGASPT
jgi:nucleotide-binding universal stress UspA family protein